MPSFKAGDKVRVLSDKQLVQNLQQGHGGWNESMNAVSFSLFAISFQFLAGSVKQIQHHSTLLTL